jgi:hypothetical protein
VKHIDSRRKTSTSVPEKHGQANTASRSGLSSDTVANVSTSFLNSQNTSQPSKCFYGEASFYGRLMATLALPKFRSLDVLKIPIPPTRSSFNPNHSALIRCTTDISREKIMSLVKQYCQQIETFYPILGIPLAWAISEDTSGDLACHEMDARYRQAFFHLIIAVALTSRYQERWSSLPLSSVYFNKALTLASSTNLTMTSSIVSLRYMLLVSVYVWLDPSAGNLSRLLGAACRICLDLIEDQDLKEDEVVVLHSLFRTTYVLDT